MPKPLENRKVLVTAGPTWAPIDRVRVISNISSGATGMAIALRAAKMGADVTLLLGPVCGSEKRKAKRVKLMILRFKYFDELKKILIQRLKMKKYDIIIHGAAISDYKPVSVSSKKIKSGRKRLIIKLRPTVKIVDYIRRSAKAAFLVMFKLEAGMAPGALIETAFNAMRRAKADMVVANNIDEISERAHRAYIVDQQKNVAKVYTKMELANKLLEIIPGKINKQKRGQFSVRTVPSQG
ncbi:MAG: phosphopantothenoylcysteine decarboxylase [Candidatus Omnitrophica bacterium]|nr:phosphopantothenoylcysteine decarboxylase [Candidatus Omnitrophota bacterium]